MSGTRTDNIWRNRRVAVVLAALSAWSAPATADGAIDFQVIHPRLGPPSDKRLYKAIRSSDEVAKLWGPSFKLPSLNPAVDFSRYTLLVADAGTELTSGYSLVFTSVIERPKPPDGSLVLTVSVLSLRRNKCPVYPSITHPIAFALIPRTDKPIEFLVYEATEDCEGTLAE
jgi:hypothetical protein